eukprot:TRINITY_DN25833_c0_g1_i5.p1 TRINITY_DN25833_c0_g1~~TRINITY_DN25833_c0_g1_i5.p1  ORF type:complete len:378 (+),score=40.79 TRINITY_DN25833_c0_g1_i5:96-1229(+)
MATPLDFTTRLPPQRAVPVLHAAQVVVAVPGSFSSSGGHSAFWKPIPPGDVIVAPPADTWDATSLAPGHFKHANISYYCQQMPLLIEEENKDQAWGVVDKRAYEAYVAFCNVFMLWQKKLAEMWAVGLISMRSSAETPYRLRVVARWLNNILNHTVRGLPDTVSSAFSITSTLSSIAGAHARFAQKAVARGALDEAIATRISEDILLQSIHWTILVGQLCTLSHRGAPHLKRWVYHADIPSSRGAVLEKILTRQVSARTPKMVELGVMEGNTSVELLSRVDGLQLLGIDPYFDDDKAFQDAQKLYQQAVQQRPSVTATLQRSTAQEAVFSAALWQGGWDAVDLVFIDALKDYRSCCLKMTSSDSENTFKNATSDARQ